MGVHTSFDARLDRLKETLDDAVKQAKEILVTNEWGAEQVSDEYKLDVLLAVKKARETV